MIKRFIKFIFTGNWNDTELDILNKLQKKRNKLTKKINKMTPKEMYQTLPDDLKKRQDDLNISIKDYNVFIKSKEYWDILELEKKDEIRIMLNKEQSDIILDKQNYLSEEYKEFIKDSTKQFKINNIKIEIEDIDNMINKVTKGTK